MSQQENENAFKHLIDAKLVQRMGQSIKEVYPAFDLPKFIKAKDELAPLELKPRVKFLRSKLKELLPESYAQSLKILLKSLEQKKLKGFDLWPYTDFVQTYGLDHFELSMQALLKLTRLFTAEFAVRPFLIADPKQTYAWLAKYIEDKDVHVRRWISEGTRPRLPWGEKIHGAIKDPGPGLKLIEKLRDDDELYVRKSVANHLNDVAKDHPELVVNLLKKWKKESGDSVKLDWIIKHSLRTLIKNGDSGALELIGVKKGAKIKIAGLKLNQSEFQLNDKLEFQFKLTSQAKTSQKLVVDYVIHHMKANGELSPKVFKMKVFELEREGSVDLKKSHSLKPVTTRKYYAGKHLLQIQINGEIVAEKSWNLEL